MIATLGGRFGGYGLFLSKSNNWFLRSTLVKVWSGLSSSWDFFSHGSQDINGGQAGRHGLAMQCCSSLRFG